MFRIKCLAIVEMLGEFAAEFVAEYDKYVVEHFYENSQA